MSGTRSGIGWHYNDLPPDPQAWRGAAFYSHPWTWTWSEIGFSGPAYPRGYRNLGGRERWEVRDTDGEDSVVFAQRVEAARQRDADRAGYGG